MGLGFTMEDLDRLVDTLSGGWAMRVALARVLLSAPDLMLLDEPTNHLDLESLKWLEDYIRQVSSAVLLISHDRIFLNRVVSRIADIHDGEILSYPGNYDRYREEKRRREESLMAAHRTQQEQIRQMERFIERNRARKDRARQVQGRIKALEKIERIEVPKREDEWKFRFPQAPASGRIVLELEGIAHGFDDRSLYRDASLLLQRGNRIAILGANGSGKSTLLKILSGEFSPNSGKRRIGHGVRIAYFAQQQMEHLNDEKTVLEEVTDSAIHPHQAELRDLLAGFQFKGDNVFKKVKVLSGGERSRLLLCKILMQGANVLLLDEPTNHLDISSREVLERALVDFEGTLCLVTHDRRLMNVVANHILHMRESGWDLYPGSYDDFDKIWMKKKASTWESQEDPGLRTTKKGRAKKRKEADRRNRLFRMRAPVETSMKKIEEELESLSNRMGVIQTEMANPELYQSSERVIALQTEHSSLKASEEALTQKWEALAVELEELEQSMTPEKADK
jgi:ATP-binding cassette subfamily F protein 3